MSLSSRPSDPFGSVTQFFHELRAGAPNAAEQLWARYFPRLVALARLTLAGRPQRHADADDAALSAFASFCIRVQGGEFTVTDRDNLWHLLSVITVRKALRTSRQNPGHSRETLGNRRRSEDLSGGPKASPARGRRGARGRSRAWRERPPPAGRLAELATAPPSDEFDLHARELLDRLDPDLRAIAVLRLMGYRDQEIADGLDCAVRTVGRKLALIRLEWAAAWPESEGK